MIEMGNIDIVVNADEDEDPSQWPGWKLVLTFDKNIQHINTGHGKDNKCYGKKCEFVSRDWVAKQGPKLDLGFQIDFQGGKITKNNVVSVKIASTTEKEEKNRIYHEMCTKDEPVKLQIVENVIPPCDTDFVDITNEYGNGAGYDARMKLISPLGKSIVNYGVKIIMSNPCKVNVFNAKHLKCDEAKKTCNFRNYEDHANAALIPGNPPKEFGFNVNHPHDKPSCYIDEVIVEGITICKNWYD